MLSHGGLTNNVAHARRGCRAPRAAGLGWLAAVPMFHLAGCVVAALGPLALRGTLLTRARLSTPELALRLEDP